MRFRWNGLLYKRISSLQEEVGVRLIQKLKFRPAEHVLDVGCGTGNLSLEIARQCWKGRVLGVDASESMIDEASKRLKDSKNLTFQVLKVEDLHFREEFDVVYSNSVFHWIQDSSKLLVALHKAVKPTGRIGLQFPLLNDWHPLVKQMNELIDHLGYRPFYVEWEFPWFVTTTRDFKTKLEMAGFKHVIVEQQQTRHVYDTISEAYDFYSAVGMECYLEALGVEQKNLFRKRLEEELSVKYSQRAVELEIERIYAFGEA